MVKNIAFYTEEIRKIEAQRATSMKTYIDPLNLTIYTYKQAILSMCKHPEALILVERTYEEDEYGTHHSSWDSYVFECTICGKKKRVNASKLDQRDACFSDLLELTQEELNKYGS